MGEAISETRSLNFPRTARALATSCAFQLMTFFLCMAAQLDPAETFVRRYLARAPEILGDLVSENRDSGGKGRLEGFRQPAVRKGGGDCRRAEADDEATACCHTSFVLASVTQQLCNRPLQ